MNVRRLPTPCARPTSFQSQCQRAAREIALNCPGAAWHTQRRGGGDKLMYDVQCVWTLLVILFHKPPSECVSKCTPNGHNPSPLSKGESWGEG